MLFHATPWLITFLKEGLQCGKDLYVLFDVMLC